MKLWRKKLTTEWIEKSKEKLTEVKRYFNSWYQYPGDLEWAFDHLDTYQTALDKVLEIIEQHECNDLDLVIAVKEELNKLDI